jgi:predicted CoA-substrate-specific enzyme activase
MGRFVCINKSRKMKRESVMNRYRIGLDIGSTTAKIVAINNHNEIVFSKYERHQANIIPVISRFLEQLKAQAGNCALNIKITGSVGMGVAENNHLPFVQEVIAATEFVKTLYPAISTIIDIGGEDAKIVYMNKDGATDLRMNGNCAGGTGAFIDQMAILLGVDIKDMNALAEKAEHTYSIASRCGVFSKTDIQNLLSKNVSKADIAASIFHAVAVQTISTLSHGCKINPKILLCGGPLTFIPALRKAFVNYLKLVETDFIIPPNANLIPAWGAALYDAEDQQIIDLDKLIVSFNEKTMKNVPVNNNLPPIFSSPLEYANWQEEKKCDNIEQTSLDKYIGPAYIGIDSGSTTTKIVVIDNKENILFSYYTPNDGNPIAAVQKGLTVFNSTCKANCASPEIMGSCSTGYGEDLIRAAFKLDSGIIETIAHYLSARKINPLVSFILDIGGQDMKAIFIENNVLSRMEINEACSSGCGSFIETFAKNMNFSVADFASTACLAENPCDLGTRCTVFMNSKVKQVLREGSTIGDIAAGLSYSVIKNCLYKVLKLKSTTELGKEIVLQGGTMKNDSVVRTFELLTGVTVHRSNMPEIMGAYGCALYAKAKNHRVVALENIIKAADYTTQSLQCRGCENNCYINKYIFANGNVYFSGNKCEKIFSNRGDKAVDGENIYSDKYNYLFNRKNTQTEGKTIGLPRCLNMYENYPFWHKLFDTCGLKVCLSDPSTFKNYEEGIHSIMSDNICFPAKLAHSHIYNLLDKKVDRIFMPYVVYERQESIQQTNSFNCPIVSGYSDVIKSVLELDNTIPIDSPVITFKSENLLTTQCINYLTGLGVKKSLAAAAVKLALNEQRKYENAIKARNEAIFDDSKKNGKITVLLAGRPYHTDPLIQHKLSNLIAAMGINVLSEDIVRNDSALSANDSFLVEQWAYINRILKAAQWAAKQTSDVHFMQMTSFGCGPDAFLLDEVRGILACHGKTLTILKIDDVNNIGSLKLRVRSVVESIKFNRNQALIEKPFVETDEFTEDKKDYKIIAPFFTPFISPLIPSFFKLTGYDIDILPKSNKASAEYGLQYANNEVCYPATLVVGDIIKALKSGKYDCKKTAVVITQTGGQCRASNYISLIKRALIDAGYKTVPVISISFDSTIKNQQSGFKIKWLKILHIAVAVLLYSDCIAKFYYAAVVRETSKGIAKNLKDKYLELAKERIVCNDSKGLMSLLSKAANEFNCITSSDKHLPKVGIVGEIYLKFNAFAHKNISKWMIEHDIEVIPPILTNFFMQGFVNRQVNEQLNLQKDHIPNFIVNTLYRWLDKQIQKVNELGKDFRYFMPFTNIFNDAKNGSEIINLAAQFGEGWLLPGEVVTFAKQGINNVISLQPFGCIANHIVAKGMEKKIKTLYPQMNLLSLDFDSGVSDVNVANRLLLFVDNIKKV